MTAHRIPQPGERWVFRRWVELGVRHRGAVTVLELIPDTPSRTMVRHEFEASGEVVDLVLARFLDSYDLETTEPPL